MANKRGENMFGKPKRFQEVSCETCAWGTLRVLVDTETGVQYLCGCSAGEGPSAITPLLDGKGNVMVSRE